MKTLIQTMLFLLVFSFGLNSLNAQTTGTIYYETYNAFTGFQLDGYKDLQPNSDLNQKAGILSNLVSSTCGTQNNIQFKIFGASFSPLMAFVDPVLYKEYEENYRNTLEAIEQDNDFFLFLGKELRVQDDGNRSVFYRIDLRLPDCTSELQALSAFEKDYIKNEVLKAINDEAGLSNNSILLVKDAEIKGLEKLASVLNQINQNTFTINLQEALAASGFKEIELTTEVASASFTFDADCSSNTNFEGEFLMVSDYACISIDGTNIKTAMETALQQTGDFMNSP